ncbi:hypothetical protein Glove_78g53 [Diversispora epigaea]|uniref:Uncharacterized protein n=1 Tax=Diversispora epigaea TaxID=1348612 RepID=A0A397J9D3_9GLOM|nr:hypothetical protein Glove_78g53 [Diversispora epigaea]
MQFKKFKKGLRQQSTVFKIDSAIRVAVKFGKYLFKLVLCLKPRMKEEYILIISGKTITATTDFIVNKEQIAMIFVEADETTMEQVTDQILFAIRAISTYVTFYKAIIPKAYLRELNRGLPKKQLLQFNDGQGKMANSAVLNIWQISMPTSGDSYSVANAE